MASVRELILKHFARESDDDLADALYVLLYSADLQYLGVDGWDYFRVVSETVDSIRAVGLMCLLPSGSVPIEVNIRRDEAGVTWSVQVARLDPAWLALSDSKRWKSLYLYATGERETPQWTWDRQYQGSVQRTGA